jgi:hypothetical protein
MSDTELRVRVNNVGDLRAVFGDVSLTPPDDAKSPLIETVMTTVTTNKFGDHLVERDPDGKTRYERLNAAIGTDIKHVATNTKTVFKGWGDTPPDGYVEGDDTYLSDPNEFKNRDQSKSYLFKFDSTDAAHGILWMTLRARLEYPNVDSEGRLVDGGLLLFVQSDNKFFLSFDRVQSRKFDSPHFGHSRYGEATPLDTAVRIAKDTTGCDVLGTATGGDFAVISNHTYTQTYANLKWTFHATGYTLLTPPNADVSFTRDSFIRDRADGDAKRGDWALANVTGWDFAQPFLSHLSMHHKAAAAAALSLVAPVPHFLDSFTIDVE